VSDTAHDDIIFFTTLKRINARYIN
jgi:hypothetical protein